MRPQLLSPGVLSSLALAVFMGGVAGCVGGGGVPQDAGQHDIDALCLETAENDATDLHQILWFTNDDEDIEVAITRDFVQGAVGNASVYALARFSLRTPSVDVCVVDDDTLDYENTHHNHDDVASAIVDDLTYVLEMSSFGGYDDVVTGTNGDGDVVLGPTSVVLVSE